MSDFPEALRLDLTPANGCPIRQGDVFSIGFCYQVRSAPAPFWYPASRYPLYTFVRPTNGASLILMTTSAGTSDDTDEPDWPDVVGARVADNTATFMVVRELRTVDTFGWGAQFKIRGAPAPGASPYSGPVVLAGDTDDGRVQVGYNPPQWQASHAYAEGTRVAPVILNGWVYEVVDGGTSGASSPNFSTATVLGATVADSDVVWRCVAGDEGPDFVVTDVRISLPATVTADLEEWGQGVWDIKITPPFDKKFTLAYGDTALWPSATT